VEGERPGRLPGVDGSRCRFEFARLRVRSPSEPTSVDAYTLPVCVTRNGLRYDLILDVAAYRSMQDYERALAPRGVYAMVGGSMARIPQLLLMGGWLAMTGNRKKMVILAHEPNKDLARLAEFVEEGKVVPVIPLLRERRGPRKGHHHGLMSLAAIHRPRCLVRQMEQRTVLHGDPSAPAVAPRRLHVRRRRDPAVPQWRDLERRRPASGLMLAPPRPNSTRSGCAIDLSLRLASAGSWPCTGRPEFEPQ
jgi:hypothetical protein